MRNWIGLLLLCGFSLFAISCGQTTAVETPYIEVVPGVVVFIVDSLGHVSAGSDTAVVVSMHGGSKFRIKPGTSEGYGQAFSWTVDDTTAATVHRIVFSANPTSIVNPDKKQLYEANFYPIVSNSTDFLSTVSMDAMMVFK